MKLKLSDKTKGERIRKKFAIFPTNLGDYRPIGWPKITGRVWLEWYYEEQWYMSGNLWNYWQTMLKWQGNKPENY